MISALGSALTGIANATSRFDRASEHIARPAADAAQDTEGAQGEPEDLVRDRVDQLTAQHDLAANAATVRTADEMIGTLINTIA